MVQEFARLDDPYMQERAFDIKDIGQRTLRNLLGVAERDRSFASAVVLVAPELTLSDIMLIEPEQLKGIVMGVGGATSHASILAKSLEIPTVVGVERARRDPRGRPPHRRRQRRHGLRQPERRGAARVRAA